MPILDGQTNNPRTTTILPATQETPTRTNNSKTTPKAPTGLTCRTRMIFSITSFTKCRTPLSRLIRVYKILFTNKMCSRLTPISSSSLCPNPCSKISIILLFPVRLCSSFTTIWYRQLADSSKITWTVVSLT